MPLAQSAKQGLLPQRHARAHASCVVIIGGTTALQYRSVKLRTGVRKSNKPVNLTPSPRFAARVRSAGYASYAAGYESR